MALRKIEFHSSPENLSIQVRAETRKTIRNYKKSSRREYVSKLESKTLMNKVWKMVRKISGKTSPQSIHLFSKNNSLQTSSVEETANIMGETFQRNSSSISHSDKFKKFKIHAEKKPLHFSSDNSETYKFSILNARILIIIQDILHDSLVLSIPYIRSLLGKHASSVIDARLWNSLPLDTWSKKILQNCKGSHSVRSHEFPQIAPRHWALWVGIAVGTIRCSQSDSEHTYYIISIVYPEYYQN